MRSKIVSRCQMRWSAKRKRAVPNPPLAVAFSSEVTPKSDQPGANCFNNLWKIIPRHDISCHRATAPCAFVSFDAGPKTREYLICACHYGPGGGATNAAEAYTRLNKTLVSPGAFWDPPFQPCFLAIFFLRTPFQVRSDRHGLSTPRRRFSALRSTGGFWTFAVRNR